MTRHGVYSTHRSSSARCWKVFGFCIRSCNWHAWCDCGWAMVYRRRSHAWHMLEKFHLADGHGGADD